MEKSNRTAHMTLFTGVSPERKKNVTQFYIKIRAIKMEFNANVETFIYISLIFLSFSISLFLLHRFLYSEDFILR